MLVGLPLWVWFVIFGMIMYNCYIISSTPEHFDNTKSQVVLFKAEWCSHCKRFKPEWDQLNDNQTLKNKVKFVTLDSEKDKEQIEKYNIQGFPTILINKNNKITSYEGPRTAEALTRVIEEL